MVKQSSQMAPEYMILNKCSCKNSFEDVALHFYPYKVRFYDLNLIAAALRKLIVTTSRYKLSQRQSLGF